MKKYIHIFLCLLVVTTGCLNKKTTKDGNNPQSFFSKTKKRTTNRRKSSFDENLEAFALDNDSLQDFAQNNNQNSKAETTSSSKKTSALFNWEDITADQSKEQFKTLLFEFNKNSLGKNQIASLKADIEYAKKMAKLNKVIVIEGHACHSEGSAIYNMTLSEQRAKHVATKFIDAGISKEQIKIAARGQEMPVVKGGNREEQSVNRRVEIFAIDSY